MGHVGNWSERKRRLEAERHGARMRAWSALGLLEAGVAAFATCLECRRTERLDLRRLARGPRAEHSLLMLEHRMRCRHCRHRGALLGLVRPDPKLGAPHPGAPALRLVSDGQG